jgi:hypothetical protein
MVHDRDTTAEALRRIVDVLGQRFKARAWHGPSVLA